MRSYEEQRKSNISQESCQQREVVKPPGEPKAPSSSSAQIVPSSREAESHLLERMLEEITFGSRINEWYKTEERPVWTM